MAARILDGRALGKALRAEATEQLAELAASGLEPAVAVVRVGDDEGAISYGRSLGRTFERAGVRLLLEALPEDTPEADVDALLRRLSGDPTVHGIMLQEPLPAGLDGDRLVLAIDPDKDIDGTHPLNAGRLFQGRDDGFAPATAIGGIELLEREGIELRGRRAVVIGRSNIVGRPFSLLLLHRHATVTICHSRTQHLPAVARSAEILAVAVGKAGFVTPEYVSTGAVVIDFGVNFIEGEMRGDVAPEVGEIAGAMTPTPGGTGPMTTAALLGNVARAVAKASGPR